MLLTCFNRRLAEQLAMNVGEVPNLHVAHFHGLCMQVAHEAGLTVPDPPAGGADRDYFEQTLPGLLEEGSRVLGPRYDAIVVDESQDFRPWWWPALLSLHVDPDEGTLYLFGDDSQNLYGGGELPVSPDDVLPPLPHNIRNTEAINTFVSVFFDADGAGAGEPKGPKGRDVEVLDYTDDDDLIHVVDVVLTNLIDQEQVPVDDIVVLTPAGRDKSVLWRRRELGTHTLTDVPAERRLGAVVDGALVQGLGTAGRDPGRARRAARRRHRAVPARRGDAGEESPHRDRDEVRGQTDPEGDHAQRFRAHRKRGALVDSQVWRHQRPRVLRPGQRVLAGAP